MSRKIPDYLVHEEIYTHEYLWRISNLMISKAKSNEKQANYFRFSALLMSYMAFEAFINFCGYVLLPSAWENEKEYFKDKRKQKKDIIEAKISKLLEELTDFVWEKDKRPYQSIKELKKFRDMIAHGKVKAYEYETFSTKDASHIKWEAAWDKFVTVKKVDMFLNDIKAFCQSLLESLRKNSDHLHLFHDAFEGPLASSRGHTI